MYSLSFLAGSAFLFSLLLTAGRRNPTKPICGSISKTAARSVLRGADNYESLRGNGLDFLVLDDVAVVSYA